MAYKNTYILNPLVAENGFIRREAMKEDLPDFNSIKALLPQPFWKGKERVVEGYWKAWELAFRHLRRPTPGNGFLDNYIDTAYNGNLFMWDSAFICLFARYGAKAFSFQKTLNNFYGKQHPDGFICREINGHDGGDCFHRYDPVSTGPNIIPWAEWEYYLMFGDRERLERIFAPLAAYYQWLKLNRTWPDGSYWGSGWASGMDNQPRLEARYHRNFSHGHMVWADACFQQIFAGNLLFKIGEVLERWQEIEDIEDEMEYLTWFVNENLWSESTSFYHDRYGNGVLSDVKSVGAYWALLARVVPQERLDAFVSHLENSMEFSRPHQVPSLSADHLRYKEMGRYWQGGVWAPTNYMVIKGLEKAGKDKLAFQIAKNHLENVIKVFEETGTFWENYSPEKIVPAKPAKPDFVGWTGLPPIALLLENLMGLNYDMTENVLIWNLRLTEEHGVENYPLGMEGSVDLKCLKRNSVKEKPILEMNANKTVKLVLLWDGGKEERLIKGK